MHPNQKIAAVMAMPKFARRLIMFRHYRNEINNHGEAELLELGKYVKPGDLALDIGCNLGVYAYELARLSGRAIAFEPNPKLAQLVASLGISGLEVRQLALSSGDGGGELIVPESGAHQLSSLRMNFQSEVDVARLPVKICRLDSCGLDKVAFIKIDVEGFEEEVLAGGMELISRDRPIMLIEIEEQHNPGGLERCRARFRELGYSCMYFREASWHPIETFDPTVHQNIGAAFEERRRVHSARRKLDYVNNFLFMPKPQ